MSKHTTRRTVSQARRAPQWARLIDTIHKAQEDAGYAGRQFGADEMRFFGASLVGMPWEMPQGRRAYWVERQSNEHSDGSVSAVYVVKAWDASAPANVETIHRPDVAEYLTDPTAAEDEAAALDAVRRAAFQVGGSL